MPVKGYRKPRICKCGETNPEQFYGSRASECKFCLSARTSSRQKGNTKLHRARHLKRSYAITSERYDEELAKQKGLCSVCGLPPNDTDLQKNLVVDHNHTTGEFRALVHGRCNSVLGYAQENTEILRAAIDYLNRHRK